MAGCIYIGLDFQGRRREGFERGSAWGRGGGGKPWSRGVLT